MKYNLRLLALACLALAAGAGDSKSGEAASGLAAKQRGVNAATLYRQAFAAMPKLDDAERKLLDPKSNAPIEATRALVAKAEPALKLSAEASGVSFCDWNLDLREGPMLGLPHLGLLQDLARLALLKARVSDARTAVEQHEAVLRMARHAASAPLLIPRLVSISIEAMGTTSIAFMLPQWDETFRNRLRSLVTSGLDPVPSVRDCTTWEANMMSAWLSNALDEASKKNGASFAADAWLEKITTTSAEKFDEELKRAGQTRSSLPKDAAGVRRWISTFHAKLLELARIIALPRDAMEKEVVAFQGKLKTEAERNLFVGEMVPAVLKSRNDELKMENMTALLRVAFDIVAKGESALPPGLATYRKTDGGFDLTSKELFRGKPIVFAVGKR